MVANGYIPIKRVVPHLGGVVEDTSLRVPDQILQRITSLRKKRIQIVHIAT